MKPTAGKLMFNKILVPMDGSGPAREALMVACALASPEATIRLVNAPELPPATDELGRWVEASDPNISRSDTETAALDRLERTWQAVGEPALNHETAVQWGPPARVIVAEAENNGVEAIVMGSRGLSDLEGLVVGSVSHKVMHTASCRVILVR